VVSNFSSLSLFAPVISPAKVGLAEINPPAKIPIGKKYIFLNPQKVLIAVFKLRIFAVTIFMIININKTINAELIQPGIFKSWAVTVINIPTIRKIKMVR
jgi:hypothetical protein